MRLKCLALSAIFLASQAVAQDKRQPVDFASLSDAQLQERLNKVRTEGFVNPCGDKVQFYAELIRRHPDVADFKGGEVVSQGLCAFEEKRLTDSLRLLKQAAAEYGFTGWYIGTMNIATQLNDGPETLAALKAIISTNQMSKVNGDLLSGALFTIRLAGLEAESDKIAYALAATPDYDQLDPKVQDFLAMRALSLAARTQQFEQVDELLRYVRAPNDVITLLSLREYEPIWPQVERYAGDNLAPVINNYVSWAAGRLADKPDDLDRLWAYSYSLLFAGRYDEAASLADRWLARAGRNGAYAEGDGWALNVKASALDALGKTADADKVFDDLAKLSPDEHPWIVNFVVNRAVRLVGDGRWQEGITASDLARSVTEKYGSPYAKMIIAGDRACAFDRLGRKEEAEAEFKYVMANFAADPSWALEALLCAHRDDEAANLARRILVDDKIRRQLVDDLQDDRFNLYSTGPGKLPDLYEFVMGRPDLKAATLKYIRPIPDRFVPLSYLKRQQGAARSAKS